MKSSSVVINTSPWIALSVCNQVDLLNEVYENVLIPSAVEREIIAGGKNRPGARELGEATWLNVMEIQDITKIFLLHELDRGEGEVIILAQEQKINQVIIDERVARMHASVAGLSLMGTLGFLLKSKKQNLIPEIRPLIEKILQAGIYIHQNIVQGILREAGE